MPYYKIDGKIENPISDQQFFETLEENRLSLGNKKTAFIAILFYLGIRVTEALRLKPQNFTVSGDNLFVTVKRLKHSKRTGPLKVNLDRPFVKEIVDSVKQTKPNHRVWAFSRVTAWKFIRKSGLHYPHYLRLNRITDLFQKGYKISEVKSWTGLSLKALDCYIGLVSISEIGDNI